MSLIYQFPTPIPVTNGNYPQFKFAVFGDNLTSVTTAGYLNAASISAGIPLSNADIVMALYSYNPNTTTGSFGIFTVSISASNGQITLTAWGNPGDVVLPTIANYIAHFTNTSGTLSSAAANVINAGNIQAGLSGTAGTLSSFPATAAKGSLILTAVANTGNTATTISNAAMGQASVISIPDPGAATANFAVAPSALVSGNIPKASGTSGLLIDSGVVAANIISNTSVVQMQAGSLFSLFKANGTEAANAVTANGQGGTITTSSLSTAGGGSYVITWSNSYITTAPPSSGLVVSLGGGTNTTENITIKCVVGNGNATITIYNNTAATSLNGTILINYLVM